MIEGDNALAPIIDNNASHIQSAVPNEQVTQEDDEDSIPDDEIDELGVVEPTEAQVDDAQPTILDTPEYIAHVSCYRLTPVSKRAQQFDMDAITSVVTLI
jgi:hypothetical protein